MKTITALTYLTAAVSPALAIITFPIARREVPVEQLNGRFAKRATIQTTLVNNLTAYTYQATVTVGTPPQTLVLQVDTGSSDVYVVDKSADQCHSASLQAQYGPCTGGQFDPSLSTTFNDSYPGLFDIVYGDKTGSSGDLITDNFAIGGATITNLIMGLALKTTVGYGLMGIGYDTNEAVIQQGFRAYPSVVDEMYTQGLINTKSYSLYLNDLTAASGSIIFGGADTQKFIGTLKSVPVLKESGIYKEFLVAMTSISWTSNAGTATQITPTTFNSPYLLDSGTALSIFPSSIVQAFTTAFGVTGTSQGQYTLPCSAKTTFNKAFISFTFGGSSGPVINVPMVEWIFPLPGSTSTCFLGVTTAQAGDTYILGDTFLRSAYVVYDLKNNLIGLAQTNFESTSSSLTEFKLSDTTIPSLTGVATGTTLEPHSSAGSPRSELNLAALGVAGVVGTLVMLGGGWFLF